jgi:hypothetical protein
MPGGRNKQSRKRELAIANLLASATIEQAAQKTGISEKCLRLWLAEQDFSRAFRKARSQVVEHAIGLLQRSTGSAIAALHRNLTCGRPGVEVNAAGRILEHSVGAVEFFDLAQRVAELEETIKAQGGGYGDRNAFEDRPQVNGQHPR